MTTTQANLNGQALSLFKDLIRVNMDSAEGFRFAAQHCQDAMLQEAFQRISEQHEHQGDELSEYVEWNGGETILHGTMAATVHRVWIAIREKLSFDDTYAVLTETERSEKHVEQAYESALRQTAESNIREVLQRQFNDVRESCQFLRQMRLRRSAAC